MKQTDHQLLGHYLLPENKRDKQSFVEMLTQKKSLFFRSYKIALLLFFSILAWGTIHSQNVYYTRNATLQINGALDGEALHLQTRDLTVRLDYETTNILIKFHTNSLETEIDSLRNLFDNNNVEVVFDGNLSLEYVDTEDHPPMSFTTEGWLTIGYTKTLVHGKGMLRHVGSSTEIACMLSMTILLNFDELEIDLPMPGLMREFEVVITQALLQNDKN